MNKCESCLFFKASFPKGRSWQRRTFCGNKAQVKENRTLDCTFIDLPRDTAACNRYKFKKR